MKIADTLAKARFFAVNIAQKTTISGRAASRILFFNLADQRILPAESLTFDISNGHISVVYASRFLSRIKINAIRDYPFEEGKIPTPENLASTILLVKKDLNVHMPQITLVVPKAWVIMKTIDFPVTVRDNLSAVISYELDRLTPLSADSSFYDFLVIREDKSRLSIMLTAMSADMLQPYLALLKEKEIDIGLVTVSTFAFATLIHYVRRKANTIFVVVQSDGYEGGLVRDGLLLSTLSGKFSSGDDESKSSMLVEAIHHLLVKTKSEGVSPLVIIDHSSSERWCSGLSDIIQAPVRFLRMSDMGLHHSNKVNQQNLSYPALGGALQSIWPNAAGMNLLNKGVHKTSRTPLALSIGLLIVLAALSLIWMLSPVEIEKQRIERIDQSIAARKNEIKKIESVKKDVETLEKELSTIGTFKTSRIMMLTLIKELTLMLPKNAWLSRVRITESIVEIEGYAASATELLPKLEVSEYFKKVDFASPTFRDNRMNADRFTIKMEIEGLPEEKKKNAKQK